MTSVVVLMAVFSGMMYFSFQVTSNSKTAMTSLGATIDRNNFLSALNLVLSDNRACAMAFNTTYSGSSVSFIASPYPVPASFTNVVGSPGPRIQVQSLTIQPATGSIPTQGVPNLYGAAPPTLTRYYAQIMLDIQVRTDPTTSKKVTYGSFPTSNLDFYALTDASTGQILQCYGDYAPDKLCNDLNGIYQPAPYPYSGASTTALSPAGCSFLCPSSQHMYGYSIDAPNVLGTPFCI